MYLISNTDETEYEYIFKLMKINMYAMQLQIGIEWRQDLIETNYRSKRNFSIYKSELIIGFLSVDINGSDIVVHTLQIEKEYQYRFAGYCALRHIVLLAEQHKAETVKCCVFENNPAYKIYKKLGFEISARTHKILTLEIATELLKRRITKGKRFTLSQSGQAAKM